MKSNFLVFIFLSISAMLYSQNVDDYYEVIKKAGSEPISFIKEKVDSFDLIIFDDALHAAVEPFEFYCEYLEQYPNSVDYVFLEIPTITSQPFIDSFFNSQVRDTSLLAKVFQLDYGYGWRYETYVMLFFKLWDINNKLPVKDRIKVIGVSQPIYWNGLNTKEDYSLFQESLVSRDYFMYKIILKHMKNFGSDKKGLFLTNTRHAYKNIKNRDGKLFWNTGTFFYQWHSGKTYAVRFHNMNLFIESKKDVKTHSTEGLDRVKYKWVRIDNGMWDEAFTKNENKQVAIPFKDNIFGRSSYIGNHMLNALDGQIMYDAYDALVFLKPLENTKFSAQIDFIYTQAFKQEIERRIKIIQGDALEDFLQKNNYKDIYEYIEDICKYVPERPNPLLN